MVATVRRGARNRHDSPSGHVHTRLLHCTRDDGCTYFPRNCINARTDPPVESFDYGS
jgi:hypothetical protein